MEENQLQTKLDDSIVQNEEPVITENSDSETIDSIISSESISNQNQEEGKSQEKIISSDPQENLILGKFKSVEDLSRAYQELQKHQGHSSEELGNLRKEMATLGSFKEQCNFFNAIQNEFVDVIQRDMAKYTAPEYFQDETFKEIYKEALMVYGSNLDTDRMVNLLETYVTKRIQANEKKKLAKQETQNVLNSMTYAKNPKASFTPPKKRFDEMTDKEVDELLERLI